MTIKELKALLENCNDDMEVNIVTNGNIFHFIEVYTDADYVYLEGYKAADIKKYKEV